jgi:AraC-like DNA-binding protein
MLFVKQKSCLWRCGPELIYPSHRRLIFFVLHMLHHGVIDGRFAGPTNSVSPGYALLSQPVAPFTCSISPASDYTLFRLDRRLFKRHWKRLYPNAQLPTALPLVIDLRQEAGRQLERFTTYMLDEVKLGVATDLSLAALEAVLASTLVRCLPGSHAFTPKTDLDRLKIAECFIGARLEQRLVLGDIARACGLTAQALRTAFSQNHGCTPKAYIQCARLNAARAALQAASGHAPVTEVATRFGFFHFGRFAAHYNAAFGELPSQTARRHMR